MTPVDGILLLLPALWLIVVALVVAACRAASRADHADGRIPGGSPTRADTGGGDRGRASLRGSGRLVRTRT